MARPKPATPRKITTMRLSTDLLNSVAAVGRDEGRTRSNMAEVMLREGVKKRERKDRGVLG